jgi:hypothetical protein
VGCFGSSDSDRALQIAGQLNHDADALAAEAAKTIGDVLGRTAKR